MEIAGCNRYFVVAKDAHGHWVARETLERHIEGVFRTRREAIRFALIETTRGAADRISARRKAPG
jgi:hypothetical protein